MNRRITLVVLSAVTLVAPSVGAQALPCADAYAESAEALISSIRVADMPESSAMLMERMVRLSVVSVERGNSSAALTHLRVAEDTLDRDLRRGRIDEVTAESLRAQIEQLRAMLGNCTATPTLLSFNCRSGDGENELLWLTPPGSHVATKVLYRTDAYPQGPSDSAATEVGTFPGAPSEIGRANHGTLANGMRYYYAAFALDSSGEFSPARYTFGRPQSRAGAFRWSYTAGGVTSPSVGGLPDDFMTASSTGFVFALEHADDGGFWPTGFIPARVPVPAAARPISLPGWATPTGEPWVLISSLEGRVWAINAATGATVWTSPNLEGSIEASVCAMLTAGGGFDDIVMVGAGEGNRGNRFIGLDLTDGSVLWSFDNGGGRDRIGAIRQMCTVDYARDRVYFTSEAARSGSRDTVWALSLEVGAVSKVWSENHPDVNTSLVLSGDAIYAGTSFGEVIAIDVADGSSRWSRPYSTGDGPVDGFVFPGSSGRLAFSTSNRVHLIQDVGPSPVSLWQPPVSMPDPNTPILVVDDVYVTDADGNVYALDASVAQPTVAPFAAFGDPAKRASPGLPFFHATSRLYAVGTAEGVLYVVKAP